MVKEKPSACGRESACCLDGDVEGDGRIDVLMLSGGNLGEMEDFLAVCFACGNNTATVVEVFPNFSHRNAYIKTYNGAQRWIGSN